MARYISRSDAAERLGVSIQTVDKLRADGSLFSVKIGRAVRIDELSVTALAARGTEVRDA